MQFRTVYYTECLRGASALAELDDSAAEAAQTDN